MPLRNPSVDINMGKEREQVDRKPGSPLAQFGSSLRKESCCKYTSFLPTTVTTKATESGGKQLSFDKQTPPLLSALSCAWGLCLGKGCSVGEYREARG